MVGATLLSVGAVVLSSVYHILVTGGLAYVVERSIDAVGTSTAEAKHDSNRRLAEELSDGIVLKPLPMDGESGAKVKYMSSCSKLSFISSCMLVGVATVSSSLVSIVKSIISGSACSGIGGSSMFSRTDAKSGSNSMKLADRLFGGCCCLLDQWTLVLDFVRL